MHAFKLLSPIAYLLLPITYHYLFELLGNNFLGSDKIYRSESKDIFCDTALRKV